MQSHRGYPKYEESDMRHYKMVSMDAEMKVITKSFAGWLHVVHDPQYYFGNKPRMLLSGSDFQLEVSEKSLPLGSTLNFKDYDVVYVNRGYHKYYDIAKNWTLGLKTLELLAKHTDLRLMYIGGHKLPTHLQKRITSYPRLTQENFIPTLSRCRLMYVPSIVDASPRILTQALSANVGLVMNKGIIGGWKYINDDTGAFFEGFHDALEVITQTLERERAGKLRPRDWIREYERDAQRKLQSFVEVLRSEYKHERYSRT
jgi:hypothetical protein